MPQPFLRQRRRREWLETPQPVSTNITEIIMKKTIFAGALALALAAPAFAADPAPAAEKAKSECCAEKDAKEKKCCCCDSKDKKDEDAAPAAGGAEEHKGHAGQ
jgi:hypothetical protein